MDDPSVDEPCRVVHLEWDRGHEQIEAIVRAFTPSGIVVTPLHDLRARPGLQWIRADELLDVEDLEPDDIHVRLADLRGSRRPAADPAWTRLPDLLDHLAGDRSPVAVNQRRTGSGEMSVGRIRTVTAWGLHLDEIDAGGRLTGDTLDFDLDEIIAVEWGTDYLADLAALIAGDAGV